MRRGARPQINVAESQRIERARVGFIIVREEFGFVGGDVDARRTVALAALAGEAEIERVLDLFTLPAIFDDFTLCHLPQQVGTAASGVFFFASGAEAWTHHTAFVAAALAYSDALQSDGGEAAVVVNKLEVSFRLPGIIAGAKAE